VLITSRPGARFSSATIFGSTRLIIWALPDSKTVIRAVGSFTTRNSTLSNQARSGLK
jgi:hypothetical protein